MTAESEQKGQSEQIGRIENGIVIDHLPPKVVWEVARMLRVYESSNGRVSLGDNYGSQKLGRKSFIKIEGKSLSAYELNLVALFAPEATISFIENGAVARKQVAAIPPQLEGIIKCANLGCVSNSPVEKVVPRIYYSREKNLFTCHYCCYPFKRDEMRIVDT